MDKNGKNCGHLDLSHDIWVVLKEEDPEHEIVDGVFGKLDISDKLCARSRDVFLALDFGLGARSDALFILIEVHFCEHLDVPIFYALVLFGDFLVIIRSVFDTGSTVMEPFSSL